MKKIFILEDDARRMELFEKWYGEAHQITHVETAEDALKILSEKRFDIILLDHDLGGEQMVPSGNLNTGYTVAKFIAKELFNTTPVVVHSLNPQGRKKMLEVLRHGPLHRVVYEVPFNKDFYRTVALR